MNPDSFAQYKVMENEEEIKRADLKKQASKAALDQIDAIINASESEDDAVARMQKIADQYIVGLKTDLEPKFRDAWNQKQRDRIRDLIDATRKDTLGKKDDIVTASADEADCVTRMESNVDDVALKSFENDDVLKNLPKEEICDLKADLKLVFQDAYSRAHNRHKRDPVLSNEMVLETTPKLDASSLAADSSTDVTQVNDLRSPSSFDEHAGAYNQHKRDPALSSDIVSETPILEDSSNLVANSSADVIQGYDLGSPTSFDEEAGKQNTSSSIDSFDEPYAEVCVALEENPKKQNEDPFRSNDNGGMEEKSTSKASAPERSKLVLLIIGQLVDWGLRLTIAILNLSNSAQIWQGCALIFFMLLPSLTGLIYTPNGDGYWMTTTSYFFVTYLWNGDEKSKQQCYASLKRGILCDSLPASCFLLSIVCLTFNPDDDELYAVQFASAAFSLFFIAAVIVEFIRNQRIVNRALITFFNTKRIMALISISSFTISDVVFRISSISFVCYSVGNQVHMWLIVLQLLFLVEIALSVYSTYTSSVVLDNMIMNILYSIPKTLSFSVSYITDIEINPSFLIIRIVVNCILLNVGLFSDVHVESLYIHFFISISFFVMIVSNSAVLYNERVCASKIKIKGIHNQFEVTDTSNSCSMVV